MSKKRRLLYLYYGGLLVLAQGLSLGIGASGTFATTLGIGIIMHVLFEALDS